MSERMQELVDVAFQSVILAATDKRLSESSPEEIAAWFARQLSACGFETEPIGVSWGVLKESSE